MRKAVPEDLPKIFDLINKAYKVEIGDSGLAFKSADRYRSLSEAHNDLEWIYVYENPQIIGVVKAQVENNVVDIGPIAVDENHQGWKISQNGFILCFEFSRQKFFFQGKVLELRC